MSDSNVKQEPEYSYEDDGTIKSNDNNFEDPLHIGWTDIWVNNEIKEEKDRNGENDADINSKQGHVNFDYENNLKHSIFDDDPVSAKKESEDSDESYEETLDIGNSKRKINSISKKQTKKQDKKELYQCNHCDKEFTYRSQLVTHLKGISGEKPYQCTFCEKAYVTKGALGVHMRTHLGNTPHKCMYCERAFTHEYLLKFHLKNHT